MSCNIISNYPDTNGPDRIKELNIARERIGAPPFLESSAVIKESLEYGLCESLVLNARDYPGNSPKQNPTESKNSRISYKAFGFTRATVDMVKDALELLRS